METNTMPLSTQPSKPSADDPELLDLLVRCVQSLDPKVENRLLRLSAAVLTARAVAPRQSILKAAIALFLAIVAIKGDPLEKEFLQHWASLVFIDLNITNDEFDWIEDSCPKREIAREFRELVKELVHDKQG